MKTDEPTRQRHTALRDSSAQNALESKPRVAFFILDSGKTQTGDPHPTRTAAQTGRLADQGVS